MGKMVRRRCATPHHNDIMLHDTNTRGLSSTAR